MGVSSEYATATGTVEVVPIVDQARAGPDQSTYDLSEWETLTNFGQIVLASLEHTVHPARDAQLVAILGAQLTAVSGDNAVLGGVVVPYSSKPAAAGGSPSGTFTLEFDSTRSYSEGSAPW